MQGAAMASKNIFSRHLDMKFDLSDNRYKTLENIGTGAYGVVCSAIHRKSEDRVAIKKIPNAFQELTTAKRTYRELKILRHFNHENVIGIREILMPKELLTEFKDVYVVMDLMESDLHQIIHSTQPVSLEHIRYFLYQIVRGLKYIHTANVVHRDLKPSNLLVNENCELKIGDFGMARGMSAIKSSNKKVFMTAYVATRWYRAPELLFSNEDYSMSVDMWSVGCIFAEMIGRKQIFPGKNPMHQLTLIVEALGMPPDGMLKASNSDRICDFFHKNFGERKPVDFHTKYPGSNKKAIDLLSKMLVFNPEERISVDDVLKHPFLSKYHDPDDEPICNPPFDFSFEQEELRLDQIRQRVGKMILKYQKNVFLNKSCPPQQAPLGSSAPLSKASLTPASSSTSKQTSGANLSYNAMPSESMLRSNQTTATVFKVPANPAASEQQVGGATSDNLKPSLLSEDPKTKELSVKTESDADTSDIDMKSACTLDNNASITANQNLLATNNQLRPALISINNAASASDVDMQSATIVTSSQGATTTASKDTSSTSHAVTSSVLTPGGDVEMNSAVGTPSSSSAASTLLSVTSSTSQQLSTITSHLGDINIRLNTDDVTMYSARSVCKPSDEKGTADDNVVKEEGVKMTSGLQQHPGAATSVAGGTGVDGQGVKTISDDTKALIKAALLNSALKNKLRKDSTSDGAGKCGGKVTVTAQSRQREREEKRRYKIKRSMERQKKMKSKCKTQEQKIDTMLTDEDKNLLARWSKMQTVTGPQKGVSSQSTGQSSQGQDPLPLMQNPSGADPAAISLVTSGQSTNPSTSFATTTGLQLFANSSIMQIASTQNAVVNTQHAIGPKSSIAQSKTLTSSSSSSIDDKPQMQSMSHPRRIMPKDATAFSGSSMYQITGSGTTLPFTLVAQPVISQNILNNPTSSTQSNNAYAGAPAGLSGITLAPSTSADVTPQAQFVIPQNSVTIPRAAASNHQGNAVGSFQPIRPMQNGPSIPTGGGNHKKLSKPPTAEHSPVSEQHSYRSRIYSDRETPSPPSVASPPSYEEALQAKLTHSRNNSDGVEDFDTSLDDISPFKSSPKPLSFIRPSEPPPDLAYVTRQLSKSMVEDIFPPLLALTPKGDGAGYGLSLVDFEDLLGQTNYLPQPVVVNQNPPAAENNRPLDSAPLSASLLSDWLEVRNLNVDDMQAVQQELAMGMTSPFNMADLARVGPTMPGLGNISPPTKS